MNNKFVRDLFTESDNTTWDLGRVQGTGIVAAALLLLFYVYVIRGQNFDPLAVFGGLSTLMAAYGVMIKLKGSEPVAIPVIDPAKPPPAKP